MCTIDSSPGGEDEAHRSESDDLPSSHALRGQADQSRKHRAISYRSDVRPSPLAGRWYPDDPRQLTSQVDEYLENAQLPAITGEVVALVAPHAGYIYSGPVAGHAFAAVRGQAPEVVAVISPMHYPISTGALFTTAHAAYVTPLGKVPVDWEAVASLHAELEARLGFGLTPIPQDPEHSLEIELPFLQRTLSSAFQLIPIMVRDQSPRIARGLGAALAAVLAERSALLVASTDLSHFYPQQIAEKLDAEILRQVEAFNPTGVFEAERAGKGFACGRGALAAVLWAAQDLGGEQVQILNYATSGLITGDFREVVGYGAAVVTRPS